MSSPLPRLRKFLPILSLAAFCLALCGCPASRPPGSGRAAGSGQSGASQALPGAPGSAGSTQSAVAPGWPLTQISLPADAVPAKLPESILKGFMEPGELTSDSSALHQSFKDSHMDYWYAAFGSAANTEDLKAHFDAAATAASLVADSSVNDNQSPGGLFQLLYSDREGTLSLRIYQDPQTPAGEAPLYILFLQQL